MPILRRLTRNILIFHIMGSSELMELVYITKYCHRQCSVMNPRIDDLLFETHYLTQN